jgi:hypothetical protein
VAAVILAGCGDASAPEPGTSAYADAVAAFYTGATAIQVGADERGQSALERFVELAPGEPSGPANLALLAYQQRRLENASDLIDRALRLGPGEARIRMLAALIARARGDAGGAIDHARRAAAVPGEEARAGYMLVQLLAERGAAGDADEGRAVLDRLTAGDTVGSFVLVASARHAARHGDTATLSRELDRLEAASAEWPADSRALLDRVRRTPDSPAEAGIELTLLAASLESEPSWMRDREALVVSEEQPALVSTRLVHLVPPPSRPAPADTGMQLDVRPIDGSPSGSRTVRPVWSESGDSRVALVAADGLWLGGDTSAIDRIALPGGRVMPDAPVAVATLDYDHDFRIDLAIVSAGVLTLLRQDSAGAFAVVNGAVPPATRTRVVRGAWPADTDLDGDVDLVLAIESAPPIVLRNRGDGTFEEVGRFEGVTGVRDFAWGDLNDDGVPDAVFIDDSGALHLFANPRQDRPVFDPLDSPAGVEGALAVDLGDMNGDGRLDLIVLQRNGAIGVALADGGGWSSGEVARWEDSDADGASARLIVADIDNNGALDVIAAGRTTRLWLADTTGSLVAFTTLNVAVTSASDVGGQGRLELVGLDPDGQAVRVTSRSALEYYGLTVVARATDQPGDRRINTFGIGGEAEVRAGLLYVKRPIEDPVVHFGIGPNTGVTVARIVWPNGTAQAEFDLLASQGRPIVAEQRLKGSCPWLFAFDGEGMAFVTDVAWRTALGLRINAYGSSTVIHSEDRVRIRGDQLVERDGMYELRITAELWESHFFDHVSLMVVDHSAGTDVFVDERFTLPPPPVEQRITAALVPVARATDHRGEDVTDRIAVRDERYADTFELGEYQGLTRGEHWIDIDLGDTAPADSALILVAHGWVQPTDGSINFALGQGSIEPPRGLRAEVLDGRGGWKVLHADLGMPAGKTKTVLIDLTGAFAGDSPRRVRLSTSMEIYWDHIAWTRPRPATDVDIVRLLPESADLRYRGFSRVRRDGRKAPELPEYDVIVATSPQWADLEGFHTRFGDVRPLLEEVDDRYVIMNAGDEIVLRFRSPSAPRDGYIRDYVFVSDAWVKDGDFNNGFSSTVRPLPWHGLDDYSRAPGPLTADPAYRLHPDDWQEYHTRYVTPRRFRHALAVH